MKKTDKIILKDLYQSSEGLFAFTLYSRYKFDPVVLSNFIEEYSAKGIITFENDRLRITDEGKKMILNQKIVLARKSDKYSILIENFKGPMIEINTPYLPNIGDVSPEIHGLWGMDED